MCIRDSTNHMIKIMFITYKCKGRDEEMPLSMVNAGEPFTIKRIGGKGEVKRHLEELGFVVGGVVTVVSERCV